MRKLRNKKKLASQSFHITAKRGNQQVASFFYARYAFLAQAKCLSYADLRKFVGLAEIAERKFFRN
jgi:hypothetical protein